MRSWLTRTLVPTVAVAAMTIGPVAMASASPRHHRAVHHTIRVATAASSENAAESPESGSVDNDSAQQAAACQKAGIDTNASNIQYDDQTGTCSIDGSGANSQNQ